MAVFVRFWRLGRESFWLDEIFSARIVGGPWRQILDRIPPDKPPLDYYLQALVHPLGSPELWHRVPAAAFGVALVLGVYYWTRNLFGRQVALITFALAAANPFLIYYSQEARPYSLFCALIVWQQLIFCAWFRLHAPRPGAEPASNPVRRRSFLLWCGMVLTSLLSLYSLYATLLVLAAELLFLLLAPLLLKASAQWAPKWRWTLLKKTVGPFLLGVGLVLTLALPLASRSQVRPPKDYFWRFGELNLHVLSQTLGEPFLGIEAVPKEGLMVALLALLILIGMIQSWKMNRAAALQIALSSVLLLPVTFLFYRLIDRAYYSRYTIYCVAGLSIYLALGLAGVQIFAGSRVKLFRRGEGSPILAYSLTAAFCALGLIIFYVKAPYRQDWRAAASFLSEKGHPGDCVVVSSYEEKTCLDYYLARSGRADMRVQTQDEANRKAHSGPVWALSSFYGDERKGKQFFGIAVEFLGQAPSPALFAQLLPALGKSPTLWLDKCPSALLGEGWGAPEFWSPDFGLRWATRRKVSVYLPLAEPGPGTLTLAVFPYTYDGAPAQSVQLVLAGRAFARQDLPQGKFVELKWPIPGGLMKKGFNRLDLEFAHVHSPSSEKQNYGDFRTLAAAVRWIRWEGN